MRPIIVEGCDNSGKTSLIKKLVEAFGSEVVLSCRSIPLEDQVDWIQTQINRIDTKVIYDRFTLISENVYGPVLRGGSKFDGLREKYNLSYDDYTRMVLNTMNPIIIYCRPNSSTISKTFHERDQLPGASENLNQLISKYDCVMHKIRIMGYPLIQYNWQFDINALHLINTILKIDPYYRLIVRSENNEHK